MNESKLNIASFFAGVGGIDLAFENAGFNVVYANEIDPYPIQTYNLNFKIKADNRDISKISASEIPDFDIMVGGFPCQAFSIAGAREGFGDKKGRGVLFFEMIRIIKEKEALGKKPQALFFENVKNLQTHDKGNTFKVILETLQELGYHVRYKVLNTKDYGNIPQNRERIYIVAFLDKEAFDKFSFDDILPIDRTIKIKDIIDSAKLSSHLYYDERFKHYDFLKSMMTNPNTVYQWRRNYVRANKNEVCPTLTANMGTGGHNVPLILTRHGIRKLTPRECFSFQGFPSNFKLPTLASSRLYKQAGNSVAVPVVQRIAEHIKKALN